MFPRARKARVVANAMDNRKKRDMVIYLAITVFYTSLTAAKAAKYGIYEYFIATSPRSRLMRIPISTLGGCNPDAYALLTDETKNVDFRAMETYGMFRAVLIQKNAVAAVMSNASCLLMGFERAP